MNKRFAVLGSGLMGRVAAETLISVEPDAHVTLFDNDENRLNSVSAAVNSDRLSTKALDITDLDSSHKALSGHSAILNALPLRLSLQGIEAAIKAGVSLIDLSGEAPEKRIELNERIRDAGIVVIPGCGVAPGISNICVGQGVELLDSADEAVIFVGGIPKKQGPPLDYKTVYSLESVLYYYTQPARIIRDGSEIKVDALSGVEQVEFPPPIGILEAFYTDGLASLIITMKGKVTHNLAEKTLRYPGHAEKIQFLKDCGMFDTQPVPVNGTDIVPRDILILQLSPLLELDPDGDILVMRIVVKGIKNGQPKTHTFDILDYLDPDTGYTAMARTTVFPAVTASRMVANGEITKTGVQFPEQVFIGERFRTFVGELAELNITVRQTVG